MADNLQPPPPPGVPGAPVTPMKKSTGKVQPKKETVRITLPPKPSAAPTIKLPTLPPGGPTGAPGGVPAAAPAAQRPAAAAPVAAPRTTTAAPLAAPAAAQAAARPAPVPRAPAQAATVSPVDTILAIAACVAGLAAIGTTVWMMLILNNSITQ
jgi:rod shape-determining protein MreC